MLTNAHIENEKPHVKTIEDGIRNVDIVENFETHEELGNFLVGLDLIGVGRTCLAFTLPIKSEFEPDAKNVFLLNYQNPAGYDFNLELVNYLLSYDNREKYSKFHKSLRDIRSLFNCYPDGRRCYSDSSDVERGEWIWERIAAHNSAFRRNPAITIPINGYYTFQGKPLALEMKFLDGVPLQGGIKMTKEERVLLEEPNHSNVLNGIRTSISPIPRQIIDINRFVPSDQEF